MADNEKDTQANQASQPSAFTFRRQFIQLGLVTVGVAWIGTFVQSKLFPQASTQEAKPVEFPSSELPVGGTKTITYAGLPVIVIRTAESIKAFSLICTHLGCTMQWQAGDREFYCACHDGRFDQFGEVIAGPPPVPLEQFPVRVEEDKVVVGELV